MPNISFEQTLLSCLTKASLGQLPGHAQFFYPKSYGYGEFWRRMAKSLQNRIKYEKDITELDFNSSIVKTSDNDQYSAKVIITSIPWKSYKRIKGMPAMIQNQIDILKYSSIEVRYYKNNLNTNAHWIYYPDQQLPYHRILRKA